MRIHPPFLALVPTKHGAAVALAGGGERCGRPPLSVTHFPLTAQLLAGDGTCLGAVFADAARNDEQRLKAKLKP